MKGLRVFAWALAWCALVAAFFFGLDETLIERVARREARLTVERDRLRTNLRDYRAAAAQEDEFRNAQALLRSKLERLDLILPRGPAEEAFRSQHSEAQRRGRVEVTRVTWGEKASRDFYVAYDLEVEVKGTLPEVLHAADRLRWLTRVLHLRGIVIEREGALYRGTLRATAFSER
jgi:Tfp pilus assembly protein PilO